MYAHILLKVPTNVTVIKNNNNYTIQSHTFHINNKYKKTGNKNLKWKSMVVHSVSRLWLLFGY